MNTAARMTLIRTKLREKKDSGMLGVVAASANVGEGMLADWLDKPAHYPSRDELSRVERALGLLPTEPHHASS